MRGMVINMEEAKLRTLEQIKAFLDGAAEEIFRVPKGERNQFVERVLKRFGYALHGRIDKGRAAALYRAHDRAVAPASNPTGTAILQGWEAIETTLRAQARFHLPLYRSGCGLAGRDGCVASTLSGPATKKLMARAYEVFGDPRYERMAGISVSHLYNLRGSKQYQSKRRHWTKTNPTGIPIGQRRAPQPDGMPGYIRIDSVHQGDQDGMKGVYHINAVDCVTQMQFVATCEKISEAYLLPVIRQLLDGFPFVILGFHSDNGSEYINYQVAKLLERLRALRYSVKSFLQIPTGWPAVAILDFLAPSNKRIRHKGSVSSSSDRLFVSI